MFKKFLNGLASRFSQSQTGEVMDRSNREKQLDDHTEFVISIVKRYWTLNETATEGMPGKKIDASIISQKESNLIEDCIQIINSENPLMENRKFLANSVISCANFQVLVLTPETDVANLLSLEGISGQLKPHILDIIQKNKQLREYFHSAQEPIDYSLAWSEILYRYRHSAADMNIFAALRVLFGDYNKAQEKDWFKPFFGSMCIYSEAEYRNEIGLPSLLGEYKTNLSQLKYSTFLNFVVNGERYPDLAWSDAYPDLKLPMFG